MVLSRKFVQFTICETWSVATNFVFFKFMAFSFDKNLIASFNDPTARALSVFVSSISVPIHLLVSLSIMSVCVLSFGVYALLIRFPMAVSPVHVTKRTPKRNNGVAGRKGAVKC